MEGEIEIPSPLGHSDEPVWVGGVSKVSSNREFEGLIDEVAILARAMSSAEVATMFEAGNPANPAASEKGK